MTGLPSTELPARLELGPADAADDRERRRREKRERKEKKAERKDRKRKKEKQKLSGELAVAGGGNAVACGDSRNTVADVINWECKMEGRRREKRERKEKKAERKDRKRKKKKQRLSGELAVAGGGNAIACGGYRNTVADVNWDCKMEGQKFGPWSASEVADIKARIKDWANAHGHSGDVESGNFDFLFGRRQKLGGRGAGLSDAERKAFLEIATGFPNRNPKQIYAYVTRHLDPSNYKGAWTEEEKTTLMNLYEQKGAKWAEIGAAIGRAGGACRDKWRSISVERNGKWTEAEKTTLSTLVNEYFAEQKATPGRGAGDGQEHRELLDNIPWSIIAQKHGSRTEAQCMQRWYRVSMGAIDTGNWAAGDDKLLITALRKTNATHEVEVDWNSVSVPSRSLTQVKRRFKEMKRFIRKNPHRIKNLSLADMLDKMTEEFAPELIGVDLTLPGQPVLSAQ
tara:strand:+ start:3147 stop:4511 length:1365 start_codon:yes stop_codon:yes gene_type:complete